MNETEFDSKARERYRRRGVFGNPDTPRKVYLNELSHRLTPSVGDFALILICGLMTGCAVWFDLPALLIPIFAVFPFLGTFFGSLLGLTTGSFRFAGRSFANFLVLMILFFSGSLLVGFVSRGIVPTLSLTFYRAETPSALLMLACGFCIFFAITRFVVRMDRVPEALTTAALTSVWLPLGISGFLIGAGSDGGAAALRTALLGLAVNLFVSLIALYVLRLFTAKAAAFAVSAALFVLTLGWTFSWRSVIIADAGETLARIRSRFETPPSVATLTAPDFGETGRNQLSANVGPAMPPGAASDLAAEATATEVRPTLAPPEATVDDAASVLTVVSVKEKFGINMAGGGSTPEAPPSLPGSLPSDIPPTLTATVRPSDTATSVPTATATQAPTATATATGTDTPVPTKAFVPTITTTMTRTLRPTSTATVTFTAAPPVNYAIVNVENDVGVLVRLSPEFNAVVMKSVMNGSLLEILDEERTLPYQNYTWVKVRTSDGYVGWVGKEGLIFDEGLAPLNEPSGTPTVLPTVVSMNVPPAIPTVNIMTFTPSGPEPPGADEVAVVRADNDVGLLVHVSPGQSAQVMKSVLNGSRLALVGEERRTGPDETLWVRVRTDDGYVGWARRSFLLLPGETASANPTEEPAPATVPSLIPTQPAPENFAVVQAENGVGEVLRLKPDWNSVVMKAIFNGAQLVLTGDERTTSDKTNWVEVRTESGHVGWVNRKSLFISDSPQAILPTATTIPLEKFAVVNANDAFGTAVFESPSWNATIMMSVRNGLPLELTGEERISAFDRSAWVQVRTDSGHIGWVNKATLRITSSPVASVPTPTFEPSDDYAVVRGNDDYGVAILESPNWNATIMKSIRNGERLELTGEERISGFDRSIWVQVRLDSGHVGWVRKALLLMPSVSEEEILAMTRTVERELASRTDYYAVVRAEDDIGAVIRQSPEWNSSIMMSVLNGSKLDLTGREQKGGPGKTSWVQVRTDDGYVGWVERARLFFPNEPTATPVPTYHPVVKVTTGPMIHYAVVFAQNEAGVAVHLNPEFDSEVHRAVLNGSLIELMEEDDADTKADLTAWVKVRTNDGYVGWVGRDNLIYPEK